MTTEPSRGKKISIWVLRVLLAALFLLLVDIGAFVAQVFALHGDWIHTIVIGLLLALLIYLQRERRNPR